MTKPLVLRLATEADLPQAAELYVENWRETYHDLLPASYLQKLNAEERAAEWRAYIRTAGQGMFVLAQENAILGFCTFKPYHRVDDCIYIDSLHVRRDWRSQGLGTMLIRAVLEEGKRAQYGKMGVCVVKGNARARALYMALGAVHAQDKRDTFTGEETFSEILLWDHLEQVKI